MTERNELIQKLNICKKEISELRNSLNQIDSEKEGWFKKKEELNRDISKLIGEVKGSKTNRDEYRKQIQESKAKRDDLNKLIREKIGEFKKLDAEKKKVVQKHNIKGDPSKIKEQIDFLETKIETEALSFDKEKSIMKEINELRKKLNEAGKVSDIWSKATKLSKEIDELKSQAEKFHKEVQSKAKESQGKHEAVIETSKEIDELKKQEEEAFKKFVELKKKFNEVNDKLQEKLIEMSKINEELGNTREAREREARFARENKKRKEGNELMRKKELVQEKIRKGEKLTTEDFLVLQGAE